MIIEKHCWHNTNTTGIVTALPIDFQTDNQICCYCGQYRELSTEYYRKGENPKHGLHAPPHYATIDSGGYGECIEREIGRE